MAATTATALPRPSLLDRKLKRRPSKTGVLAFLVALATGVVYIVFHVAHDLDSASVTSYAPYAMLGLALLIALGFEFVNGFHDTANAVATVIYTHSLEPNIAVVVSGICNLAGVLLSSGTVAFAVITLLPVELILQVSSGAGFAMVFALLIAAILWNLGTWWLGLPASSSHTMVGSIIGVGIANQLLTPHTGTSGVDWEQAMKVLKALLISPVVGFVFAGMLILIAKQVAKFPALYEAPKDNMPPPLPIRALMVLTCTGVSFFHGSNDGQKGMGLIMLILIGTVPTAYALNHAVSPAQAQAFIVSSQQAGRILDRHVDSRGLLGPDARTTVTDYIRTKKIQPDTILALRELVEDLGHEVALYKEFKAVPPQEQANVRNDMYVASEALRLMIKADNPAFNSDEKATLNELQRQGRSRHKIYPVLGQGGRSACARSRHHGWMEAHGCHCGRAHRQRPPDLRPGSKRRPGRHGNHLRCRQVRTACKHHTHSQFWCRRNDVCERKRAPLLYGAQHRRRLGFHVACCSAAFGRSLLGIPPHRLNSVSRA